jgi:trk system potassium uptake protein TrkA
LLAVSHLHGFNAEVIDLVAPPDSPIVRKPLSKIGASLSGNVIIGSVFRDGKWVAAVGDTHIQAGERVIVVCNSLHLKEVRELFSF